MPNILIMKAQKGAEQAVKVCMGLKSEEKISIITDRATLEVAKLFEEEARKITNKVNVFVLEDYGERPLKEVPKEIKDAIDNSDVGMLAVSKVEGEAIRRDIRMLAFNKIRYSHMPGINKKVLETGLATDQRRVWEITDKVFEVVKDSRKIEVKSKNGTNLTAEFDSGKIEWVNSGSDFSKLSHTGTNLPGAEVFSCPVNVNGVMVIDGELGDYFTKKYGFLKNTPIKWEIKGGRVVDVECSNKKLEEDFREYINKDENANRIGEFALGTNVFIKELIGIFLQDEKFPSVHLAVGNPYPERTKAGWESEVHCDGIIMDADVIVDGKEIMKEGKFTIER